MAAEICKETLKKTNDSELAAVCLLEKYSHSAEEGMDMINSEEYRSILFITSFFPFISNTTPVIEFDELIDAQEKAKNTPFDLNEIRSIGDPENDVYSIIMQEALNNVRSH